jgi:dTDP-4-amino-4,6-dideoxygalactose transaminase
MLNRLIPYVLLLKDRYPRLYSRIVGFARRHFGDRLGSYPKRMGGELAAVESVLSGSQWNMTYGRGLPHEQLEEAFAKYVGVPCAVAVNTGGMALQMSIRALGIKPGDEVLHQVDTCSATAFAVAAASTTPLFADILPDTLMLDPKSVEEWVGPRTKAILATHIWGTPENMPAILEIGRRHDLPVIEDACLSLGALSDGKMAGSHGRVGCFSFGANKPIQCGEGGMIVTEDESLARELRAMRHWGDRTIEYGVRDTTMPAWNGRLSEVLAAILIEQLKGYPRHLADLRDAVADFQNFLTRFDGIELALGVASSPAECAFTQVTIRIDEAVLRQSKSQLKDGLFARGIPVWHANFEPINSLSLFKTDHWKTWMPNADHERIARNYATVFPVAQHVYDRGGLGLGKMNFLSRQNLQHLKSQIETLCVGGRS